MTLPAEFEPAVRDPKKLRRTAWILVAIIVIGGWLIVKAYEVWAGQQSKDDRPAVIHRIQKERDLRIIRQDGKTVDLFDLRGHVWAVHVTDSKDETTSQRSLGVMKRLALKYSGNPDFNLVSLTVDPLPADDLVAALAKTADAREMKLPQWWLGSNEPGTLHKFIKSELKASTFPHEANGKWNFDSSIVLIDRNGHLRRAVVPQKQGGPPYVATFDFDQAAQWDAKGVKTGTDLNNEAELEVLLVRTIDKLLAEPAKN